MVNTRSTTKREQERKEEEQKVLSKQLLVPTLQGEQRKNMDKTIILDGGSAIKSEQRNIELPGPSKSRSKSSVSQKSSSSSVVARRKKLELEAAEAKARIQMDLIDKKLQVDLAELNEDYSPPSEQDRESVRSDVARWVERSQLEMKSQQAHDAGNNPGSLSTPAPVEAGTGTDVPVQQLVSALKELATVSASNSNQNAALMTRISTPRDLPLFFGEPLEWIQFKQAFEESTKVCGFSDTENIWRLRKCLRGPAKESVNSLLMCGTSPETIISTLELQYGNPELIISRMLMELKKLHVLPPEYHREIVPFAVKIKNYVTAVRALRREEYLQEVNIVAIVLSKLPTVLLPKWTDYSYALLKEDKSNLSKLDILSNFLHEEAVKVSTCSASLIPVRSDYKRRNYENSDYKHQTVLVQSAQTYDKCRYCRVGTHNLSECKKFKKSLRKDRWQHVKRFGICYKCLLPHHDRQSCAAAVCDVEGCGQSHHRLLHYVPGQSSRQTRYDVVEVTDNEPKAETVTHININKCEVLLKVVPVNIHGPNGAIISTSCLLDDGSSITCVSAGLAKRAGLSGRRECLRVRGAWDNAELVCETQVIDCTLSNKNGTMFNNVCARIVDNLNLPAQNSSVSICENYNYLEHIKDYLCTENLKPEILIGQDNYHLLVPLEVVRGGRHDPCATRSPLGWCLHGRAPTSVTSQKDVHTSLHLYHNNEQVVLMENNQILRDIHDDIRRSLSVDTMGVSAKPRQNSEDLHAQEHLEQTSELIDGQWYIGLPWKDPHCVTVDSFPTAMSRLKGVELKMKKCTEYAQRYKQRIQHLLDNKYAEKMQYPVESSKTWYLPHFGIDNPNKRALRLVFDGAAKSHNLSLNSYLFKGPDLLVGLMGIMLRFRENKIGISGDIQDMFLRVKIKPEDQHALRFLYRENPEDPVDTYIMTSLIFGANCAPFVAQFVKNKNVRRFEKSMPEAANAIYKQHYVDDYIDSLPDEKTAKNLIRDVTYIHAQGNFHIRNWNCNSEDVIKDIPKETLGNCAVKFKVGEQYQGERTLGLLWQPAQDTLGFDVSLKKISADIISGKERPTKRDILRVIMSIFDIYGFLSPFTINGKLIIQDTWQQKICWDEPIPDTIYEKWLKWICQLKSMREVRLPRYYYQAAASASETLLDTAGASRTNLNVVIAESGGDALAHAPMPVLTTNCYQQLELHTFCDASTKIICAVAYWRWYYNEKVHQAFIASKCRVATLKPTTVPRMELNSAVLAARLAETITKEHRIKPERRIFWSDSTTVLHWIRNDARNYKTYVAHRLGEIDEFTRSSEWRYIPTQLNVADIATRENYDRSVLPTEWMQGPPFLQKCENEWPQDILNTEINKEHLECVMTVTSYDNKSENLPVPEPTRFSSWLRLRGATFMVLKFINKCKQIYEDDCDVMEKAERLLIRYSQAKSFSEEIFKLKSGSYLPKTSRLLTLSPYLDEHEVLRVGGRIDAAADVAPETKRPSILDGREYVARLLVRHYHVRAAHGNQETVVNNLKQTYWILKLRPTVKSVSSRCMLCRIRKCKQEIPRMGDLPHARVAHHQRPYTHTGADLFGPLEVTVGRRREKRYGVLFTCLTVRSIHIEIVESLTSDSFIMALRRMAARRGWPQYLYSDNGTNLRGSDAEIKKSIEELDQEYLKRESLNYGTKWIFVPPASPHWAGAWERLIRTVKGCLKVVLKERAPRDETLRTLMAEVESIVNSRPLTHVSVEPGSTEALTPNHFLLGSSSALPHLGAYNDTDMYLRKQWRIAQRLADLYWKRWVKEILPDLIPRRKWTQEERPLQVGDLVLIVDPDGPRCFWPKGIIHEVLPGKDGRVRAVRVKTKTGVLMRSAARVARIPIDGECC